MPEFLPNPKALPARRKLAGQLEDLEPKSLLGLNNSLRQNETVFPPKLPETARGFQHVATMYPNPPKVELINDEKYEDPFATASYHGYYNKANLHANSPPSTTAHEFEHAAQYGVYPPSGTPESSKYFNDDFDNRTPSGKRVPIVGLSDNLAKEVPATILGRTFPYAERTSQAKNPAIAARNIPPDNGESTAATFTPDYQPQMSWMNQQAHRHGVYGENPFASSMGFKGKSPVPMTSLIADNPQWLGLAAGQEFPGRPPSNTPYKPQPKPSRQMPDLTGYLR